MKRTSSYIFITLLILYFLCLPLQSVFAYDANPQSSFATTIEAANPSAYLNFNDKTSTFYEQISNNAFVNSKSGSLTINAPQGSVYGGYYSNTASFMGVAPGDGTVSSITIAFYPTPSFGQSITIMVGTLGSGSTFTVTHSFTVTTSGSATQTFVAGTDFTSFSMLAGQYLGHWSANVGVAISNPSICCYYTQSTTSAPTGTSAFSQGANNQFQMSYVINYTTSSGTVIPRQPGFDSTQPDNTSAAFPWNGFSLAPNNTMGTLTWSTPWAVMAQVDRLNWNKTGTLVLASKGDQSSGTGWSLYLQMNGQYGNYSQLCFDSWGAGAREVENGLCTNPTEDAMPNGFNYNIVVTDSGTGGNGLYGSTAAKTIYINGVAMSGVTKANNGGVISFGDVNPSVSGGTGYPGQLHFGASGGGPNCHVSGIMWSSGGVPYNSGANWFPNGYSDYGCTSVPTLTLDSSSGSGATLTATLDGEPMDTNTSPLMVPGSVNAAAYYGVAGTTNTQTPTYIDDFAIFPVGLTQTQVQDLFYQTKFYQSLLNPPPANKQALIFDEDGCGDEDDFWALQGAIAEHRLGYVKLEGVVAENTGAAIFRQMLDQAGLSDIPVGVVAGQGEGCNPADLTTYNASTPTNYASYPSAATVFREVMAANSTTPVNMVVGGPFDGPASFMESSADSISSMTGMQLWNRDATNGGAMYILSAPPNCTPSSPPAVTPCSGVNGMFEQGDNASAQEVVNNHGTLPLIHFFNTPQSTGPGPLFTRTNKDPAFLFFTSIGGDNTRQGWDSLPQVALVSNYFYGGVQIGYSGGTGYANSTYFTSTGGGTGCNVQGIMTASGGVPNGIEYLWGATAVGQTAGIGYGCIDPTNPPTIVLTNPTGAGVTLTAYTTNFCSTYTMTSSTSNLSSSPCGAVYFPTFSTNATGGDTPIFTWFVNSLVDPPQNGRPLAGYTP